MTKLKSFLTPILRRYKNSCKVYSNAAEILENARSSLDPFASPTRTIAVHRSSKSAEVLKPGEMEISKDVPVVRNICYKSKKGKKCGQPKTIPPKDTGPPEGGYIMDKCGLYDIPKTNSKKWKTISFTLLPIVLALSAFIMATKDEYPKREFIPYEHMYIRTKRFPWGDGKKSLFHGPNNFIPEEESKTASDEQVKLDPETV